MHMYVCSLILFAPSRLRNSGEIEGQNEPSLSLLQYGLQFRIQFSQVSASLQSVVGVSGVGMVVDHSVKYFSRDIIKSSSNRYLSRMESTRGGHSIHINSKPVCGLRDQSCNLFRERDIPICFWRSHSYSIRGVFRIKLGGV